LNQPLAMADAPPLFDLLSPEVIADPYPLYNRLRSTDPVHRSAQGYYMVSRYADVSSILRDKRFGKDFVGRVTRRQGAQVLEEPVYRSMRHWMLQQDPPDHTRLRGLVVRAFTPRRVDDMRPRIHKIVDATIEKIKPRGHADLIADFAFRLPVAVICDMLGIPPDHHEMFLAGAPDGGQRPPDDFQARLLDRSPLSRAEMDTANACSLAATKYFQQLVELRRRQPRDDLISSLVQAEEHGSKLTNDELIANVIMLFGAGHVTTVNLIGNGLLALHRNPDQLKPLRDDPSLTPNAIEELLRYDSPVQAVIRTVLDDVKVGRTKVMNGESVLCLLGAANRDPEVYHDPDRLDITRQNFRPLSFGGGIHFCVGNQLGRIEAEIAIATLLRRLPNLTLNDPEHVDWHQTLFLRGLKSLPASWSTA